MIAFFSPCKILTLSKFDLLLTILILNYKNKYFLFFQVKTCNILTFNCVLHKSVVLRIYCVEVLGGVCDSELYPLYKYLTYVFLQKKTLPDLIPIDSPSFLHYVISWCLKLLWLKRNMYMFLLFWILLQTLNPAFYQRYSYVFFITAYFKYHNPYNSFWIVLKYAN
jgi:hypothetical protein